MVAIQKPGVYLVRPPWLVEVKLNREVLVVFSCRFPKLTGVVLFDPDRSGSLYVMLDILRNRLVDEMNIDPEEMSVKVFGMFAPSVDLMLGITRWVERCGFKLDVTETGSFLSRECVIDSESGRVGVLRSDPATLSDALSLAANEPENRRQTARHP